MHGLVYLRLEADKHLSLWIMLVKCLRVLYGSGQPPSHCFHLSVTSPVNLPSRYFLTPAIPVHLLIQYSTTVRPVSCSRASPVPSRQRTSEALCQLSSGLCSAMIEVEERCRPRPVFFTRYGCSCLDTGPTFFPSFNRKYAARFGLRHAWIVHRRCG